MLALFEHFRGIFTEKHFCSEKVKIKTASPQYIVQLCKRNFYLVLLKIIKFRYNAYFDWLKTHGLREYQKTRS